MECQDCHERPATLHFTQVINGNKTEVHVCDVCAKEKGYVTYPEEGYSLHNLLTGLFNFDNPSMGKQLQQVTDLQCPLCKLTFAQFKQTGKFGCAECYHTFSDRLDPIFRRVHSGNTKHHGKIPKRKGGNLHLKKQLHAYKDELQQLIQQEAFEKAATVRDKIKDLEKQIQAKKAGDNE
ncbi:MULTISPECIES: UvrB/UvrC motif-containing protein [unclassified Virgibacillus]|uniref:UvrB/UvrC motif-containing protein n=1 Tax=unclassified Virgibacillus TaxID=2620237 RepID=UPI0024DE062A|nr:UvrB/UvrC motif-containing protein [Virgibacillus sp. LDC-1]